MPRAPLAKLVHQLKAMVAGPGFKDLSDRQLLDRFAQTRDEAAFAALVDRHGPLVLGVCRRVLHHDQDAEDAFQATFLVLARKATKVVWHESVRSWLYQVAHRLALEARSRKLRQQAREQAYAAEPKAAAEMSWQEVRGVLEEELARLPAKFRGPLLLCYLEGKTRDEAAELLGWSVGAVKGQLERGRKLLRARLTRRGLTLSAALFATLLGQTASAAPVPALLTVATIKAGVLGASGQALAGVVSAEVLALTGTALRAMVLAKLKLVATVILTVGLVTTGAGYLGHRLLAGNAGSPAETATIGPVEPVALAPSPPEVEKPEPEVRDRREKDEPKKDRPDVQGLLQRVDRERRTIHVRRVEDGEPPDRTYALDAEVQVRIDDNKPGQLANLVPTLRVSLFLAPDRQTVTRILAEGPVQKRLVKEVDLRERFLVVVDEGVRTQRLPVAADAAVTVNSRRVGLGDLPPGPAQVKLAVDLRTVIAITATPDKEREEGARRDK